MDPRAELIKDLIQVGLDLAGIVDPTGVADGTSMVISLWRREWMSAGVSALGIVPYLGDLAKAGKIPKYVATVQKAVKLALKDSALALELRRALPHIRSMIDRVPAKALPDWARHQLLQLRSEIDDFLGRRFYNPNPKHELPGAGGRKGTKLDISSDDAYQLLNDPQRAIEVAGKKQFVAVKDGKIYVFQPDNAGAFHAYPSTGNEVYSKYPSVAPRVAEMLGIDVKRLSRLGE